MIWLHRVLFFAALLMTAPAWAEPALIKSVALGNRGPVTQLVFEFASGRAKPQAVPLHVADRVLLRFDDTRLSGGVSQPAAGHPLVRKLLSSRGADSLKFTVELKTPASVQSRSENRGARLVVDLKPLPQTAAARGGTSSEPKAERETRSKPARALSPGRGFVIAIDAGHGGKDTGAIGPSGTLEKDVVFAVAQRLEGLIKAEPGMRAVMVRRGDHFVDLRQRADLARKARADLFVSIHADAYVNSVAKGSSVFTLSSHGASSVAARWLADRANASDLLGGVKLRDKGKLLASVLLDLSQNATQESSHRAAQRILGELEKNHALHHRDVQKAGFVVLMSPDMPSLLVETAFISNPREEQSLRSPRHQEQLARAIFAGIRRYFGGRSPAAPKGVGSVLLAAQP